MSIRFTEYHPPTDLLPNVDAFWEGDFNTPSHDRLSRLVAPNGFVELIVHLTDFHCRLPGDRVWTPSPPFTVIGLHTEPYEVRFDARVRVFGIRLKPEGVRRLFGVVAAELTGRYEDLESVTGSALTEMCARIRDAADGLGRRIQAQQSLRARLDGSDPTPTYVDRAAMIIRSPGRFDRIESLPGEVHISLRQLERSFKKSIGMTPKRYMRLARLNDVHRRLEHGGALRLTDVAYECGYADQAHFIRDFRRLMGTTPSVFRKERDEYIVNAGGRPDRDSVRVPPTQHVLDVGEPLSA